jgi:peptidoglycan hydrolase-like protein with peptidoglycan-binding domain
MKSILCRSLLASGLVLALALPGWAAEQAKPGDVKQEHAQKRAQNWDQVKKIQEALKAKGEDPGPIDGHMGKKTHEAIRVFQKSNGLKVTGKVNRQTAEKLGVELAAASGNAMMKSEKKSETR